jgi:hypothetical protein
MKADPKTQRETLDIAWLAALARAGGDQELSERYIDSMMRSWAPLRDLDLCFDGERLHGASGDW